jgi:hypothetical protein
MHKCSGMADGDNHLDHQLASLFSGCCFLHETVRECLQWRQGAMLLANSCIRAASYAAMPLPTRNRSHLNLPCFPKPRMTLLDDGKPWSMDLQPLRTTLMVDWVGNEPPASPSRLSRRRFRCHPRSGYTLGRKTATRSDDDRGREEEGDSWTTGYTISERNREATAWRVESFLR